MPLSRFLPFAPVRLFHLAPLAACLLLAGCGAKVALFSQIEEKEANEMLALLTPRAIAATKEAGKDDKWVLKVATDDFARAVELYQRTAFCGRCCRSCR